MSRDIAFDLCVVCGDFISRSGGFAAADDEQEEKLSTEEGEMSAILGTYAQESIKQTKGVARVWKKEDGSNVLARARSRACCGVFFPMIFGREGFQSIARHYSYFF